MVLDVDISSFDTLDLMELLDYDGSLQKAWEIEDRVLNDAFGSYSKASELNNYLINNPINIGTLLVLLSQAGSLHGYEMAMKRLANDPKQMALKEIEAHYQTVKSQFKRRGYSAQFIREMYAKYPIIQSQKTIENLVTVLNKENDHIPR